jgi:precorrin-2 dehydrogenase / sirohydrochlorin ferrochelatase
MSLFPLMVELSGKRVVVVGGGKVGRRKAAAARAAGAVVVVVDPVAPADISASYSQEHLDGAQLVFACATPDVNARVVADATARGLWVNSATDDGDAILPAVVTRGDLTIAVSTGGASPALARRIREKLDAEFDDAFREWVQLLAELRPVVLVSVADPDRRRALLDDLADWRWLAAIRTDGVDAVRAAMRALVGA